MIGHGKEGFLLREHLLFCVLLLAVLLTCAAVGSVSLPLDEAARSIWRAAAGRPQEEGSLAASILLPVRLPRVLCAGLVGAALSLCGGAMQGLLKNPLADGSTLGVSSGASLGAVIAIAFGISIPGLPFTGTMVIMLMLNVMKMAECT